MNKQIIILLIFCFISLAPASDNGRYWIFFTDKPAEQSGTRLSEERRSASDRVARRRMMRANYIGEDETDRLVSIGYITELEKMGLRIHRRSRWLNAVSVYLNETSIVELKRLSFVREIKEVKRYIKPQTDPLLKGFLPATSTEDYGPSWNQNNMVGIPFAHELGYHGQGVRIALFDTGFILDHVAFQHLDVIATWDFINGDADVSNQPGDDPHQHDHGTVVLSVIAGYAPGQLIGPAYGSEFLLAKTDHLTEETKTDEDNWIAAAEWAEQMGADIISSSVGYILDYTYEDLDGNTALITKAANMAVEKGISVFVSAGNERFEPWKYILVPGDGYYVNSIGGVRPDGSHWPAGSIGPTYDGRIKPDLAAQSQNVYAVHPGMTDGYISSGGTSVSCPIGAGAGAIMLSARPVLSPIALRDSLIRYASQYHNPDTLIGYGIIDLEKSLKSVVPKPGVIINGFMVNPQEGRNVLQWTAEEEIENDSWIIEHRTEMTGYQIIGEIPGREFAMTAKSYTYYDHDLSGGEIFVYRLSALLQSGVRIIADSAQAESLLPTEMKLFSNSPNPFNTLTRISFGLNVRAAVSIKIFNIRGQQVKTLLENTQLNARYHHYIWDGRNDHGQSLSSGAYYLQLIVDGKQWIRKMIVLR